MPESIRDRFLHAVSASYAAYVEHGARSPQKLRPLHGWVRRELIERLGEEYSVVGITVRGTASERAVKGRYYTKKTDVAVSRHDRTIGVVSIKFIQSNYKQNRINYLEQQLGETANLRSSDIVFGHIMVFTEPIPYKTKGGHVPRYEHIEDRTIEMYASPVDDHGQRYVPDAQCIAVFLLDVVSKEITRECRRADLPGLTRFGWLEDKLNIDRFFDSFVAQLKGKAVKVGHWEAFERAAGSTLPGPGWRRTRGRAVPQISSRNGRKQS